MTDSFVCAFRGRRDSYQVPLALAEASLLDQFITDAYSVPWLRTLVRYTPSSVRAKVEFRGEPGIPPGRVNCLWGTTLLEHARHRLGYARRVTQMKFDRRFSRVAARRAASRRSHLFLYSPYAWEAFVASYPHSPRRVLFQYHPHPDLESRILEQDGVTYPRVGESFSIRTGRSLPEKLIRRERDCWKHADLIICASQFTRRSLLEAGADEHRCHVVPYGIDVSDVSRGAPPSRGFQAVFVGSGGQRKGLHHLLLAWRAASLPADSKLTLVCRVMDREIQRLAATVPRLEVIRGATRDHLESLYAASSLLVMPSLVEGFGQVYLEALAQGCPVLGTENTCLPDLGTESDGVFLAAPGEVRELSTRLETLAGSLPGNGEIRRAARACAERFSWPAFREGIRRVLHQE